MGLQGYVGSAADQARIRQLEKEREEDRKLIEAAKQKLAADQTGFRSWKRGEVEVVEQALKKETIGLVTRDQYVEKKSTIQARLEAEAAKRKREAEGQEEEERAARKAVKEGERKAAKVSFHDDDDDDDEPTSVTGAAKSTPSTSAPVSIQKNDEVATDFLPDAKRERALEDMRLQLKQEWMHEQEQLKKEQIPIQFSYWDGSGHKRSATIAIGDTVGMFLKVAKGILEKDFPNLRFVTIPNLLLVKDDVMLPQGLTFYYLLVGRAHNGKGQVLFQRHASADKGDAGKAHAAKVVQRSWYESNKHIYPASRWELFDESKHISD